MKHYTAPFFLLLALAGCAATPEFEATGVDRQLIPVQASNAIGKRVIWGGIILSIKNLADATQLEILAYPVDSNHRPDPTADPIGRFLLRKQGYLESAEYSQGRYVSVLGRITGTKRGRIDENEYLYPVVEAEKLFLWPKSFDKEGARIHFGIGVIMVR